MARRSPGISLRSLDSEEESLRRAGARGTGPDKIIGLWPWKNELLNQLDLAARTQGPRGQRREAARAGQHITDEEVLALPDVCSCDPDQKRPARDLAMIALAIAAGPRVHEIIGVSVADVSVCYASSRFAKYTHLTASPHIGNICEADHTTPRSLIALLP